MWHFLAEMPLYARGSAARPVGSSSNQMWWSLYQKVRTHFQQNP